MAADARCLAPAATAAASGAWIFPGNANVRDRGEEPPFPLGTEFLSAGAPNSGGPSESGLSIAAIKQQPPR